MPGRPEVLLVYKKSQLKLYQQKRNRHIERLLEAGDVSVRPLVRAHEAHEETLGAVRAALKAAGVPFTTVYRASLKPEMTAGKLVVTVGGDGTLLDASHSVVDAPVLGVNSDPRTSVGFLCMATAATFATALAQILDGARAPVPVARLHGEVDGQPFPFPVLNDLLVAHKNPAATCRYILEGKGVREDQKSSGIWACTPAGSTAAMASAGGAVQTLDDARLQIRVREPYAADGDGPSLVSFFLEPGEECCLISRMREGRLWLDGPHEMVPFPMGARLTLRAGAAPLLLFVDEAMRERREAVRRKQRARRRDDEPSSPSLATRSS